MEVVLSDLLLVMLAPGLLDPTRGGIRRGAALVLASRLLAAVWYLRFLHGTARRASTLLATTW